MANGAQCCALEICCPPASLRANLPGLVAKSAGLAKSAMHEDVIGQVLDFMQREGLTFAPISFQDVIQDIVQAERVRVAHASPSAT